MCRLSLLPNIAQALCHTKQNFQDLVLVETVKDMASTNNHELKSLLVDSSGVNVPAPLRAKVETSTCTLTLQLWIARQD
jgi:hypothetical protein